MIILNRFKLRPFPSISIRSKTLTHNIKNSTDNNSKIPLENDGPVIGEEFLPTNSNTKTRVAKILATFPTRMDPIANSAKLSSMDAGSDEHKESNKEDHASLRINFDSSHYVNMLKAEGFTDAEANGLIALVSEVVNESMASATKSLVSKFEKKRFLDACLNELKLIKTDVSNLELRDFANLKKNLESIKLDVESSKTNMVSDLARIRAGARLDMNLEKSSFDVIFICRIQVEAVDLKAQLKIAEDKIDQQIDKLEARMNSIRKSTKVGTQRFLLSIFALLVAIRLAIQYSNLD